MSSKTLNQVWIGAAGIVLALAGTASALACPLCSEETEAQAKETGINVSMGYSVSVLVMIAVPMSMVGGMGYALYRNAQQMSQGRDGGSLPPQ